MEIALLFKILLTKTLILELFSDAFFKKNPGSGGVIYFKKS